MAPRTTSARTTHSPVTSDRLHAAAGRVVEGSVCSVLIVSDLTESSDAMRVDPVRIEPPGHEIAGAHPGAAGPLPEGDPGPGRAGCGGKHLHPLEGFLHATGTQRMGVREGSQEHGGDVPVHHR